MAIPCPVCDAAIDVDEDELEEGDSVTCDECGADLVVASLDPLELESLDEEEEDEEAADLDEDEEEDEEDEPWK
jgi:alpha-aminoadipate/glutamate carrier protein LysW